MALGYRSRTDLAASLQFTVRTLADIEHGVGKASPVTYANVGEQAGLGPGKHRRHPGGRRPQELVVKLRRDSPEPRYDSFTSDALSRASTEELLLEVRRRIIRPRDRHRETWDDRDGLDSRGDWPDEG